MKDVNGNRRRWSLRRVRRSAPANLAVAALPLGAHAQQSAGLEPRQLFGYGRSDWSCKLTQDWDPKRLRTSGPQAHRQGLRSASASRRGENS
jgi:hypothetical protein